MQVELFFHVDLSTICRNCSRGGCGDDEVWRKKLQRTSSVEARGGGWKGLSVENGADEAVALPRHNAGAGGWTAGKS